MQASRSLSYLVRGARHVRRGLHSVPRNHVQRTAAIAAALGGSAALAAYGYSRRGDILQALSAQSLVQTVQAASTGTPQPNVFSQTKDHALYLWIHLKPDADAKQVAKVVANLQKYVDQVVPPKDRDEDDEIWAGVGFGPNFYAQVSGGPAPKNYVYPHRKGVNGEMPSTGGEVFIHAKSNQISSLFHLAQVLNQALKPQLSSFADIYSFVYRNGRDLSGFIDGTENSAEDGDRFRVAVEKNTGGSYCITQKWIHDLDMIAGTKQSHMEDFIGRNMPDSIEMKRKPATSHVARMTSGTQLNAPKPVEIVRQSMPFGTVGGEAGLFFIGFAEDPYNFEYMLDRMVGATKDGLSDNVMKFSKCVAGSYWYFPSQEQIDQLAK